MRIIAGEAGGIPLQVPRSVTRPTTDRVREAVFSSLGARVPAARVLDLYAGSGALGLEALSRGADHATFVDHDRQACAAIEANLLKAKLDRGRASVLCRPVRSALRELARNGGESGFDLVFADPPYARDEESAAEIAALLADSHLQDLLGDSGLLVFESMAGRQLPIEVDGDAPSWVVDREKRYGDTQVCFLNRGGPS